MTHTDTVGFLDRLEQRHDVQRMVLCDAQVWPLLRITIGETLLAPLLGAAEPTVRDPGTIIQRMAVLAQGLLLDRRKIRRLGHAELYFSLHNGQRCLEDGRLTDRFALPLMEAAERMGLGTTIIEHRKGLASAFAGMDRHHLFDATPLLEAEAMIHWRRPQPRTSHIAGLDALLSELMPDLRPRATAALRDRLHSFDLYMRFHRRLLARVRPRCVPMVPWYSVEHMAISHACSEMGIGTVDLQHGVQGAAHLAYGNWSHIPANGWSLLPRLFWCWDAASAAHIATWADGTPHRAMVLGDPWFERSSTKASFTQWCVDGRKHVLFTAQPVADVLPDMVLDAMRATRRSAQWIVRTHPNRPNMATGVRERLAAAGSLDDVLVDDALTSPLGAVLKDCDLHVTHYSSVVIEAANIGVPSAAIHASAAQLYPNLLASGALMMCDSSTALEEALHMQRRPVENGWQRIAVDERLAMVLGALGN